MSERSRKACKQECLFYGSHRPHEKRQRQRLGFVELIDSFDESTSDLIALELDLFKVGIGEECAFDQGDVPSAEAGPKTNTRGCWDVEIRSGCQMRNW